MITVAPLPPVTFMGIRQHHDTKKKLLAENTASKQRWHLAVKFWPVTADNKKKLNTKYKYFLNSFA